MRKSLLAVFAAALLAVSCSANYRAKHMGGTMTVKLQPGSRLVTVTWKEGELWYLTRPRTGSESPITWTFREKSSLGLQEGTVVLVEQ